MLEILVVPRRTVRAERELVAARRAGHAQARIAVDVVGAQEALGQLVGDVLRLGRKLAGNVQGHGVGSVCVDDPPEAVGHRLERHVERHALEGSPARRGQPRAALRVGEAVGGVDRLVNRAALGAEAAEVGGMVLVAADARDAPVGHVQNHPATDPAIRADGLELLGGWRRLDGHRRALRSGRADPSTGADRVRRRRAATRARPPGAIHLPTQ